jgi:hypothetical protein
MYSSKVYVHILPPNRLTANLCILFASSSYTSSYIRARRQRSMACKRRLGGTITTMGIP